MHDQTSGGQTFFTGLADARDGFTNLFARLSVAFWLTELAAFGNQDVNCVLLDDTEGSVIIVHDQTSLASPMGVTLRCFWRPRCGRVFLDHTMDFVIIVHDQTSGGQTVFAALACVHDCFTDLFARLSVACEVAGLAAFW